MTPASSSGRRNEKRAPRRSASTDHSVQIIASSNSSSAKSNRPLIANDQPATVAARVERIEVNGAAWQDERAIVPLLARRTPGKTMLDDSAAERAAVDGANGLTAMIAWKKRNGAGSVSRRPAEQQVLSAQPAIVGPKRNIGCRAAEISRSAEDAYSAPGQFANHSLLRANQRSASSDASRSRHSGLRVAP